MVWPMTESPAPPPYPFAPEGLDATDPATLRMVAAWARYRRLMRLMFGVTLGTVIIALSLLYKQEGMVSVHFYIAAALGISFMMLLMSALMGLVFFSNASGHDDVAQAPREDDQAG